jgi:RNA polymerase sigma factor for flagellar operon FliA
MPATKQARSTAAKARTAASDSSPLRSDAEVSKLVEDHLELVNHVVFQAAVHFPRHVDRNELINAGAIGLVEAAKRYEESRGVPFNRFAAQRIRGAIIDAVRAADWAPRSVRKLARRLDAAEQALSLRLGRPPSLGETAEELEMSPEELHALRDRIFRSVVLAFEHVVSTGDEDELTLVEVLADEGPEPDDELEQRELKAYLREAVVHLPERHRLIVIGYFIQERTSAELARFLGVTESRISQMRSEALAMLRRGIEAQYDTPSTEEPEGLVGRRRAAYAQRITETSGVTDRICERSDPESDEAFCREIDRLVELTGSPAFDDDGITDLTAV